MAGELAVPSVVAPGSSVPVVALAVASAAVPDTSVAAAPDLPVAVAASAASAAVLRSPVAEPVGSLAAASAAAVPDSFVVVAPDLPVPVVASGLPVVSPLASHAVEPDSVAANFAGLAAVAQSAVALVAPLDLPSAVTHHSSILPDASLRHQSPVAYSDSHLCIFFDKNSPA